jgi:hypothetical protein
VGKLAKVRGESSFHDAYPQAADVGPHVGVAAIGEMCCVCVDHSGQRRTYEDPRRFVKRLASLLGSEQEGSEERALDEFLESSLGQPHELLLCQALPVGKAVAYRKRLSNTG